MFNNIDGATNRYNNTSCHCEESNGAVEQDATVIDPFSVYCEGDELFTAMLDAISNAEISIYLESYIFATDEVGQRFIVALQEKAMQGVDVRIHIDAAGSGNWLHGSFFKKMIPYGVKLKWFHRWAWKNPLQFNVRNHRKILVVDGTKAFIGGFNIHNESSRKMIGVQRWFDCHVAMSEPTAKAVERYFLEFWNGSRQFHLPVSDSPIYLLPNFSKKCRFRLRCEIGNMLKSAKESVRVATPYFVPDSFLLKRLIATASRGVRVELMVPRLSDNKCVDWAVKNYYTQLLMAGIEVYEYQPRMLHAKLMIVDDVKVMIGSANVDYRSLFVNFELVLITSNNALISSFRKLYSAAKTECHPISAAHWKRIAWRWWPLALLGYWLRRLL
ncbi:phospholipase D-like domain-containing protein [Alkalimarinus alittae]|uniref:Phospholipase D-like domain-containing protein n=1 Tax=Alkalimarinus alittae TaxID=2961619 RepID=A0ABY6MXI0_9ALTE|nr:phospholipase D-like domain-containing protein [Alkalimarinus alittae]UZE94502.1 phospholipase D-like domain-containing protein [Alkalimarinus alittae]